MNDYWSRIVHEEEIMAAVNVNLTKEQLDERNQFAEAVELTGGRYLAE